MYYPDAVIIIVIPFHGKPVYAERTDDGRNHAMLPDHQHDSLFSFYFFCKSGCVGFSVLAVYWEVVFCGKRNDCLKHPCVTGRYIIVERGYINTGRNTESGIEYCRKF